MVWSIEHVLAYMKRARSHHRIRSPGPYAISKATAIGTKPALTYVIMPIFLCLPCLLSASLRGSTGEFAPVKYNNNNLSTKGEPSLIGKAPP